MKKNRDYQMSTSCFLKFKGLILIVLLSVASFSCHNEDNINEPSTSSSSHVKVSNSKSESPSSARVNSACSNCVVQKVVCENAANAAHVAAVVNCNDRWEWLIPFGEAYRNAHTECINNASRRKSNSLSSCSNNYNRCLINNGCPQ